MGNITICNILKKKETTGVPSNGHITGQLPQSRGESITGVIPQDTNPSSAVNSPVGFSSIRYAAIQKHRASLEGKGGRV